jgi:pimeloyl-ACP methyl ester carboxylesterase
MKVATADVDLAFEQFGAGPDIVWISGGSSLGRAWHRWQIPYFERTFRNTTFDNRGIGSTRCTAPTPWAISDVARDTAALIEAVCNPPVAVCGLSMGAMIAQQLILDRPELVRCAVAMGTAARSTGYLFDWMQSEIDLRRAGRSIDGMFALAHYMVYCYPAEVLGDDDWWAATVAERLASTDSTENDDTLVAQWQACNDFDCLERLSECQVPLHVIAFAEDVQTPPQRGREVADAAPMGEFHLLEGMGHCSLYGHTHDKVNALIEEIVSRYL